MKRRLDKIFEPLAPTRNRQPIHKWPTCMFARKDPGKNHPRWSRSVNIFSRPTTSVLESSSIFYANGQKDKNEKFVSLFLHAVYRTEPDATAKCLASFGLKWFGSLNIGLCYAVCLLAIFDKNLIGVRRTRCTDSLTFSYKLWKSTKNQPTVEGLLALPRPQTFYDPPHHFLCRVNPQAHDTRSVSFEEEQVEVKVIMGSNGFQWLLVVLDSFMVRW